MVGSIFAEAQRQAGSYHQAEILLCKGPCLLVVTLAVFLPQTKDVTKAMNDRKFDEAMKLRGR